MPSLKQLRRRLRTVTSTKLITRAMRSVAASKLRKTQDRRIKAKPYVNQLQSLVAQVLKNVSLEGQPLLQKRSTNKRLIVVFSSDRGLCGAFNATICRYVEELYSQANKDETSLYIVGKRAYSYFQKQKAQIAGHHIGFGGDIDVPQILKVAQDIQSRFLSGEVDQVELVYNHSLSAMIYRPRHEVFLPLQRDELLSSLGQQESEELWETDYIFEPDPKTLLGELLPKFVETKVLYTFIDAFSAEHQARMLAMTTANENCSELMDSLTLQANKARQGIITKELLEIVGGAEALRG